MAGDRRVYSTEDGDLRGRDRTPRRGPVAPRGPRLPDDGVVRVFREKSGRGGKTVTVVRGLPRDALAETAGSLKRHCGCGGSVQGDAVEIQGDHREKVAAWLGAQGRTVKLAGG